MDSVISKSSVSFSSVIEFNVNSFLTFGNTFCNVSEKVTVFWSTIGVEEPTAAVLELPGVSSNKNLCIEELDGVVGSVGKKGDGGAGGGPRLPIPLLLLLLLLLLLSSSSSSSSSSSLLSLLSLT